MDRLLGAIIHEYAHQFRKINSQYGEMFEEVYAIIFAETCINYSKIKNLEKTLNTEMYHALTSVEYRRAESQVRGLMFALRNKKMDIRLMLEYILGNEKATRIQNVINQKYSLDGKSPEQLHETLIDICSDYIQFKSRTD